MGIADFFRPKHRHSDARVRAEAVRALGSDDAATLIEIARTDRDIGVRRIAIGKISRPDALADIASVETERSLRDYAGERASQLWLARACSDDPDEASTALNGILKLGEQLVLVDVVVRAATPAIRKRAFGELRDPRALAELAKRDAPQELRTAAVARIDDGDVLRGLAIDTTTKEVGLAAVEKIDDVDRLESVAQKAKNKAVRQKARKIVSEIEEAERAKRPGVPDEVKRKRAERAQLVREVEAVADSFDFAKASEIVTRAEAAWVALGPAEEGDDRFARTVERFWKRKELHDSQARTADELRAIEREAAAERTRAKEPAATAPKPAEAEPDDYVRPDADQPDPKREAREAEAKARREERDRQRAEEDARREAQAAERAAKAKEEAERSASITASLAAMCDDLEQLAGASAKDTRAIDRVLAQAAKAFENIGKVVGVERDKLADRYRTARGKLVAKAGELREAEDWQRWTNVPKAEALIETAKQMLEAASTPDLGNRLRQLQALWKEVGPMPQRRSKELWEQFKATCDQVYDKVKGVRAVEQEKFDETAKIKEALIAEAESIADSTDWAATAERLKGLQQKWKQSGHMPRKQGDELWKRFRAACDRFFERRKPMLDAQHAEQTENLERKHALVARAQAVADRAPGKGGWGKAIGEIKDLQGEWKEIGFVPRRDADAIYRAFRAACDALFEKRDAARDSEADAHRAELDELRGEIDTVIAGGDDVVPRAIAARARAREHGVFAAEVEAMIRHVVEAQPDGVRGTELDPAQLRARREKLIARAEELLPKQPAAVEPGDLASQLKQAMQKNAFGALRFSGRDPVEVVDDLRASWAEGGPILDDEDRAQVERFESTVASVLEAAGVRASERPERGERGERPEREEGRRRRRDRRSGQHAIADEPAAIAYGPRPAGMSESAGYAAPAIEPQTSAMAGAASVFEPAAVAAALEPAAATSEQAGASSRTAPVPPAAAPSGMHTPPLEPLDVAAVPAALPAPPVTVVPDASSSAVVAIATPDEITSQSVPVATHDAITQPARLPPEVPLGVEPPVRVDPLPPPPARKSSGTMPPPMDEVDGGWDLGDEDPTATPAHPAPAEPPSTPSSSEMAGDGVVEGDGLDQVD